MLGVGVLPLRHHYVRGRVAVVLRTQLVGDDRLGRLRDLPDVVVLAGAEVEITERARDDLDADGAERIGGARRRAQRQLRQRQPRDARDVHRRHRIAADVAQPVVARSDAPALAHEVAHRLRPVVVHHRLRHVGQAIAGGDDEPLERRFIDAALGRQPVNDARTEHDQLAELGRLERDPMVHVPEEPRRFARERAVAVRRDRARAAHADVVVDEQALHQPLERIGRDQQIRRGQADGVDRVRAIGVRQIGVDRRDLPAAGRLDDQTDRRSAAASTLADDVGRTIGAAGGDDDDLDDLGATRFLRSQRVDEEPDVALFVVCGNRDADSHRLAFIVV
jgi:hypothetical protein